MTRTCSFVKGSHKEFSIKSIQNQTNTGETEFRDIVLL